MKRVTARPMRPASRSGFTLMEVLLVSILSAVLMIGLWSLFGTYIRLFESGPERTERAQLLRALKQQFTDDLRGAIQIAQPGSGSSSHATFGATSSLLTPTDAAAGASTAAFGEDLQGAVPVAAAVPQVSIGGGGSSQSAVSGTAEGTVGSLPLFSAESASALPRFGIVGTSQSLAICTLQIPTGAVMPPLAADTPVDLSEPATGLAPELKAVIYTFSENRETSPLDHGPPPGLIRRETDWQSVLSNHLFASVSEFGAGQSVAADDQDDIMNDESAMWVPEVTELRIRYFGGGRWQDSWDSLQKKALPTAVEITMELEDYDEGQQNGDDTLSSMSDSSTTDDDDDVVVLDNEVGSSFTTASESRKRQKRFLIYLPGGLPVPPSTGLGLQGTGADVFSGEGTP